MHFSLVHAANSYLEMLGGEPKNQFLDLDEERKFKVVKLSGHPQKYQCYCLKREFKVKEGKRIVTRRKQRNVIYDIANDRILSEKDVFSEDYLKKIAMLGDSKKLNMLMNDKLLMWSYLKSKEGINYLVYAKNPECFSEEFLTFMGLDAVLAMKAEAQKQEALKKQERAQKQEGTPKQEGTQKQKSPKKQKLLAQSQKVKGWMEEDDGLRQIEEARIRKQMQDVIENGKSRTVVIDESLRDGAYIDQAPEFPPCTYTVVSFETMKTIKNPGGQKGLLQYISDHIAYPTIAEENGIQGRVVCSIVIERDGSVTDVQVVRSIDPSLDTEAVLVLKKMPKWIPGRHGGQVVRARLPVSVTFRLQ